MCEAIMDSVSEFKPLDQHYHDLIKDLYYCILTANILNAIK
jgi:thermostable 8-oxoguanine DNA glycosylase